MDLSAVQSIHIETSDQPSQQKDNKTPNPNPKQLSFPSLPFLHISPQAHITVIPQTLVIQQHFSSFMVYLLSIKPPQGNVLKVRKVILHYSIPELSPHPRRVQLTARFSTARGAIVPRQQTHCAGEFAGDWLVGLG